MRIVLATLAALAVLAWASPAAAGTKPERPTVVVKVSRGFDWTAAAIGAAATAGLMVAIAGGLQALRHERKEDL
jgi:hypothetical protein